MSFGKGLLSKINALLIWRILLVLVVLANIGLAATLWMSGSKETADAGESGRRILYALATGAIEGKQVKSADLALTAKPEDKPEAKPAEHAADARPVEAAEPAEHAKQEEAATPQATEPSPPTVTETPAGETTELKPEAAAETPANQTETPADAVTAAPPQADTTQTAPADATVPADPAQSAEVPAVELPGQPVATTEEQAGPVSPEPPKFEQALPATPTDTSDKPAVVPDAAPKPPLADQPAPAVKPSSLKLPAANPQIIEKSAEGDIPVIAKDGTKAWRYYARPFERSGKQPMVAIIITGLGQNRLVTDHALALDENVTLSFSPYARGIEQLGASARLAGHEVMVDLPVDPSNYPATDPGPYGLLLEKPPEENEARLRWLMSRVPTSVGFITPRNERYTASIEHMKLLMQSLANRGLMLVITRDSSKDETKEVLGNTSAANVVVDFLIDEDLNEATIGAKLLSIEQLAQQRGFAVGVAQPYPLSIAQLKQWIETLANKGIVLVPISAVARLDYS